MRAWVSVGSVSGERSDESFALQVLTLVNVELERLVGRAGARLDQHVLVFGEGEREARSDVKGTLAQWDSLPEDLRARRARQIAELLVQGSGPKLESQPRNAAPRGATRTHPARRSLAAPLFIMLVTSLALIVAYRVLTPDGASLLSRLNDWFRRTPRSGAAQSSVPDPDQERARLAQNACDQARARISRGATVSPADVEGFQIELVLLRRGPASDLSANPALAQFITRSSGSSTGTVTWPGAKSLLAARRFDATVTVRALPPLGSEHTSGLSLDFAGPYAVPYFTDDQRSEYEALADALAEALSATDGGLFAHCAGSHSHYVGSWFLGVNPGAAVAALVYFMGAYSEAPMLLPEVLGPQSDPQRYGRAFDFIEHAARNLDRSAAATLIGRELGTISARPQRPTRLHFPFRDGNRATRSSLDAARSLKLANAG